ncbi:MAG TPA: LEA type 2 family protein, partial [Chitinophagaceae bacterium]|nr:LEA type 2 family protein [Chitinophagaceae bacterium]
MQTTTRFLILFITALVLQSASCKNIKELDYKGIQDTQWQALGLKNASILINLKYYNPNSFGIDVKESNLSIYLNDRFLAVADQPSKTQIPRESEFLFPVVAHFDPLKALGAAFTSLLNKK